MWRVKKDTDFFIIFEYETNHNYLIYRIGAAYGGRGDFLC